METSLFIPQIWAAKQNVAVPKAKKIFEELENKEILNNIAFNVYITTKKSHNMSSDEWRKVITQIRNEYFDTSKTKVEVSGVLMEDTEFTTEKDPSEIMR